MSLEDNYRKVFNNCNDINKNATLIVVSKSQSFENINKLINLNHCHFGENKVQEALVKWNKAKETYKNIKLHLVGRLQSNKITKALSLFDYIHSLDSRKLASELSLEENKQLKKIKYFIQVNTGKEIQKSGILEEELLDFYKFCKEESKLNVIGLMCLPPVNDDPRKHFRKLKNLSEKIGNLSLSMGMSNDYHIALEEGATHVRVGSAIFSSG